MPVQVSDFESLARRAGGREHEEPERGGSDCLVCPDVALEAPRVAGFGAAAGLACGEPVDGVAGRGRRGRVGSREADLALIARVQQERGLARGAGLGQEREVNRRVQVACRVEPSFEFDDPSRQRCRGCVPGGSWIVALPRGVGCGRPPVKLTYSTVNFTARLHASESTPPTGMVTCAPRATSVRELSPARPRWQTGARTE